MHVPIKTGEKSIVLCGSLFVFIFSVKNVEKLSGLKVKTKELEAFLYQRRFEMDSTVGVGVSTGSFLVGVCMFTHMHGFFSVQTHASLV